MASTQLSLIGTFPIELYQQVHERLSAASQSHVNFSIQESVWGRGIEPITDENRLRLKFERTSDQSSGSWSMQVLQKPEPLRLSPEMLSRQVIDLSIGGDAPFMQASDSKKARASGGGGGGGGDPAGLVSALGYEKKFEYVYKGDRFRRGAVVVEVYRLYESIETLNPLDPSSYVVSLTNKIIPRVAPTSTTNPSSSTLANQPPVLASVSSAQELKTEGMGRMREMVNVLRGLVDLKRAE